MTSRPVNVMVYLPIQLSSTHLVYHRGVVYKNRDGMIHKEVLYKETDTKITAISTMTAGFRWAHKEDTGVIQTVL